MTYAADIRYGISYAWTDADRDDDMRFATLADVLAEVRDPGTVTGHPRSYYPCSGDIRPERGEDRATVAFVYRVTDDGEVDRSYWLACVTVGPRGGYRLERG